METTNMTACALSDALHQKKLSSRELMQATLDQIDRLNPTYNAVVNLQDRAGLLAQADARDAQLARGESKGWLHGMPIAVKDLANAAGIPTTLGSPLMKNFVPQDDAVMVARMKAAGAIVIGKTNTPEFGLGSHSFNEVFGATGNAYDVNKTAGGSSGGAAVALALRMVPVADGSDFMGSLRNPAGWNNVFGMRPSQGRVPSFPAQDVWVSQLGTDGPMARTVSDLAKLLSVQAGYCPQTPLSIAESGARFAGDLRADVKGRRIGWLGNLNGYLPMEAGILEACENGLRRLEGLGCAVSPMSLGVAPDGVWQTWLAWRRVLVASRLAPFFLQAQNRALIKPEALWEHDQAQGMTAPAFLSASVQRSAFYQHMLSLFDQHDVLALPVAQVWPFPKDWRWPQEIVTPQGTVAMDTYHRWMEVVIYATLAGLPSISVPVGFNAQGLPMGMQLIGKPQGDFELLQLAKAYEDAIGDWLAVKPAAVA
jgi:amidase